MKLEVIIILLLAILFVFGCAAEEPRPHGNKLNKDGNFDLENGFPEQILPKIIKALNLPEASDINDIKLNLGLLETSSNEEVMQALKDQNILGGRFR
jgi:hypothetical protein